MNNHVMQFVKLKSNYSYQYGNSKREFGHFIEMFVAYKISVCLFLLHKLKNKLNLTNLKIFLIYKNVYFTN